jgi:hypothetical protein
MYSWLLGLVVRAAFGRLNKGDVRLVLAAFAPDAHFIFPGRSSFAADHRSKPEIEAWFRRFVALRPQVTIHDVTVAGPPWNIRASVRFSDRFPRRRAATTTTRGSSTSGSGGAGSRRTGSTSTPNAWPSSTLSCSYDVTRQGDQA